MASIGLRRMVDGHERDRFELGDYIEPTREEEKPSDEEINIVVAQIKRLARNASLEFALSVGAVIIHHFYGGETDAWRSRGPKTASFRALARHPDLPLSAGSLCRCVALFELCDRLNAPARWEHLSVSHLRLVLGLPQNVQERILATANARRWSVRALQEEVAREKSARITSGGRRAAPPILKSLKRVRNCLDGHRELIERSDGLSSRDLQESMDLIEETRECLERLSESIRSLNENAGCARGGMRAHPAGDERTAGDRTPAR